jgi:Icc-related predicted phosphoesterase
MTNDLGQHLFTYAVITDTHLNQGETECNSPFEVNKLANARMRHVIRDLNTREVDFVLHLGDLLHPVPHIPHLYEAAAERFKDQVKDLRHKLYVIPGNHDVGDKPVDWCPAGMVRDEFLDLWDQHFGAHYQAFDHGGVRFILIDAQIVNSGLAAEDEQKAWLETELAEAEKAGKRVFLNTHYPPYLTYADEDEHYDNMGEPGRSWILGLMEKHKVEAMFAGHVHNFWYHRHGPTQCWLLPSTAFVRQDYSEMYRATPPVEFELGRNDWNKLGYFIVHVHETGHLCEIVRTYGHTVEPGAPVAASPDKIPPVHPMQSPVTRFGFDMRQNWLEVIEIPPSGGLDEFDRKRTRNDYALMALMEMGVRRLRIPARDLLDKAHRARLDELAELGFSFTLFSFDAPDAELSAAVRGAKGLIDAWEVAQNLADLPVVAAAALPAAQDAGAALYLSKLRSKDEMERGGETYYHMINHGFTPDEADQIAQAAAIPGIAGIVFRVAGETPPAQAAEDALAAVASHGLKVSLHIRMSVGSPGAKQADEGWVAARAAEALAAAQANPDAHVFCDTFADVDRGYFARQGVVDRLYNPRPAFHVLRHLTGALAAAGDGAWRLGTGAAVVSGGAPEGPGTVIDLATGERRPGDAGEIASATAPTAWIARS